MPRCSVVQSCLSFHRSASGTVGWRKRHCAKKLELSKLLCENVGANVTGSAITSWRSSAPRTFRGKELHPRFVSNGC